MPVASRLSARRLSRGPAGAAASPHPVAWQCHGLPCERDSPMLGAWSIVLALGLTGAAPAPPVVTPDEFRDWFDAARTDRLDIPAPVSLAASSCRYIFVAGFYNERMPNYFAQNARELRDWGVPAELIHTIAPSSDRTLAENAEGVRERFQQLADLGPEPLVVIAHSRGACDALAFALANPRFVRTRIRAMFLVQGAFGGSGLADYVTGERGPLDHRIPLRYRALTGAIGRVERRVVGKGKHAGLAGLTHQASEDFWAETLDENADAIPVVGPRTFYVTTETSPSRLRLFKRATGWYLQTYEGLNDGVVALEDQSLPVVGTVLATLEAGHADLTNR